MSSKKNKILHYCWAGLLGIAFLMAGFCPGAKAYPNDPDGFRNMAWGTPKSALMDLVEHEKYSGFADYIKKNDDMDFEGLKANRILYGFTDDRLESVGVQFEPPDDKIYLILKDKLTAKYGVGEPVGEKGLFWRGGKTNIKLNVYGNGVEIFFSDNKTFEKRGMAVDEFKNRFREKWGGLLEKNDTATAVAAIKLWLDQEGKDVLDSYQVSPDGDQISFNFKGLGTEVMTAGPIKEKPQGLLKNIYSVKEVLAVLSASPDQFKGKDLLIRAEIVDGTRGIGCHDYLILTDPEYASLYRKQYDPHVSEEEMKAIKNIPRILSGPALAMPQGIFKNKGEGIYRGHFFDQGMKPCEDGSMRFIIIDKE